MRRSICSGRRMWLRSNPSDSNSSGRPARMIAASAPLAAATARVLHFARMPDLYATLPPADATRVRQEMMWYTTLWCCSKPAAPKTPGHIFYDMFFDVVPHTDKSRREWTEPWTPKFGP
mmetsp:Transcript_49296/g.159793  ORF Transcript_49296/g.159793 Transcript_49296/m.159793 type:complete len:119 (-) Transcript_49296:94-450(-)